MPFELKAMSCYALADHYSCDMAIMEKYCQFFFASNLILNNDSLKHTHAKLSFIHIYIYIQIYCVLVVQKGREVGDVALWKLNRFTSNQKVLSYALVYFIHILSIGYFIFSLSSHNNIYTLTQQNFGSFGFQWHLHCIYYETFKIEERLWRARSKCSFSWKHYN